MPSDFFYFLSSLPLLRFGVMPPLSYPEFLTFAQEKLTADESALLSNLALCPSAPPSLSVPVIAEWEDWETFMRNSLVALRSKGNRSEAGKWQRGERGYFADTRRRLEEVLALPNAWEREQALDRLRWQKLNELQGVHFYDFTAVIIYAYRLLLLNRQASWNDEEGGKAFAALLDKTTAAADSCRINEE